MEQGKVLKWTKIILALVWLTLILYVATASIKDNPIRLPYKKGLNLIVLVPQGWGFFTRDPREPVMKIYKKTGSKWVPSMTNNASAANFFGIKRDTRIQGVEIAWLLRNILQEKWQICQSDINAFSKFNKIDEVRVENTMLKKSFCGERIIQIQERIPWAWSNSGSDIDMPSKIIRVAVACE